MKGACNSIFLAPGEGSKGQVTLNFNYKVNFKDFYTKLCVFSHKKDKKQVKRDVHYIALVMPQGWDFGALGCPGGHFFKHGHVAYQIDGSPKQTRKSDDSAAFHMVVCFDS